MTSNPDPGSLQIQVLRAYSTLLQLRADWGGSFVLSLGLPPKGSALAIASNIAGAVSLSIDDDETHLREVVRAGAVDFVVHSLDEAVRAMKNEVRKRTPLSVALSASPIAALQEIVSRGMAPQLFSSFISSCPAILQAAEKLMAYGADLVDFDPESASGSLPEFRSSVSILDPFLKQRSWHLRTFSFQTLGELRDFEHRVLKTLPLEDTLRRRWLEVASRILPREKPPSRALWLSSDEEDLLS
jgi:urocanate hydratase